MASISFRVRYMPSVGFFDRADTGESEDEHAATARFTLRTEDYDRERNRASTDRADPG